MVESKILHSQCNCIDLSWNRRNILLSFAQRSSLSVCFQRLEYKLQSSKLSFATCSAMNKSLSPVKTFVIPPEIWRVRCGRRDYGFDVLIDRTHRYIEPSIGCIRLFFRGALKRTKSILNTFLSNSDRIFKFNKFGIFCLDEIVKLCK